MAKNVTLLVSGGTKKIVEINTVAEGLQSLGLTGNYTASINGNPANMSDEVKDFQFVTFAAAVKGNAKKVKTVKPVKLVDNSTTTAFYDQEKGGIYINGVKITKAQVKKLVNSGLDLLGYKTI